MAATLEALYQLADELPPLTAARRAGYQLDGEWTRSVLIADGRLA